MTKAQILEAYKNDLILMAKENKRLTDLLQEAEEKRAKLTLQLDELREENSKLRLQNISLLKRFYQ